MSISSVETFRTEHPLLVEEYQSFSSSEERLAWLMERSPLHPAVPEGFCTPERRVPGCLSGLWLHATHTADDLCIFSAQSESAMVQGVVSFLCDLYSGRAAQEIIELGGSLARELRLDGVLSLTRRRAVESAIAFFVSHATSVARVAHVA